MESIDNRIKCLETTILKFALYLPEMPEVVSKIGSVGINATDANVSIDYDAFKDPHSYYQFTSGPFTSFKNNEE